MDEPQFGDFFVCFILYTFFHRRERLEVAIIIIISVLSASKLRTTPDAVTERYATLAGCVVCRPVRCDISCDTRWSFATLRFPVRRTVQATRRRLVVVGDALIVCHSDKRCAEASWSLANRRRRVERSDEPFALNESQPRRALPTDSRDNTAAEVITMTTVRRRATLSIRSVDVVEDFKTESL